VSDTTEAVAKKNPVETAAAVPVGGVPVAGIPAVAPGAGVPVAGAPAVPPDASAPAVGAPAVAVGASAPAASDLPEVRRALFQPLQAEGGAGARDNIGMLMDVVVTMTVQLGGSSLPLREVLKLGPGSVVRLERALGEPVDILINRELVGRGEVVVVDDRFGVRVTELLDPKAEKP